MPSTLVHLAIAGLLATALLGRAFSTRALAVVLAAVVVVDLDVFLGYYVLGAHRAAFHNLLLPGAAAALLLYDTVLREESSLAARFGRTAPRVAWTTVAAVVFAAIGPDLVNNGANLFYPVHDQFYVFDGRIRLSDQRGILQTFVEEPSEPSVGSSEEVQYRTGADPDPQQSGADTNTERVFLVVESGFELLVVVVGTLTAGARVVEERLSRAADAATPGPTPAVEENGGSGTGASGSPPTSPTPDADPTTDRTEGGQTAPGEEDVDADGEAGEDDPWVEVPSEGSDSQ